MENYNHFSNVLFCTWAKLENLRVKITILNSNLKYF